MKDNQRIAVTKRMLQEGLMRLLQTTPIDKIKVVTLCEESGINRATFYRHYTLPQEVLEEIRIEVLQQIRTLVLREAPRGNLRKGLEIICQYCHENTAQLILLFPEGNNDSYVLMLLNEFYLTYLDEFQKIQQRYHIDDQQFRLASSYYAGGILSALRHWQSSEDKKTPTEVASILYRLITGRLDGAAE